MAGPRVLIFDIYEGNLYDRDVLARTPPMSRLPFPATGRIAVTLVVELTGLAGRYRLRDALLAPGAPREVILGHEDVEPTDPDKTYDFIHAYGIRVHRPGAYEFRLYADDALLDRATLTLVPNAP